MIHSTLPCQTSMSSNTTGILDLNSASIGSVISSIWGWGFPAMPAARSLKKCRHPLRFFVITISLSCISCCFLCSKIFSGDKSLYIGTFSWKRYCCFFSMSQVFNKSWNTFCNFFCFCF